MLVFSVVELYCLSVVSVVVDSVNIYCLALALTHQH